MVSKKKKGGGGSLLDKIDLTKQRPKAMEKANHLFKFIQQNPGCTRPDMVRIVRWATKDNLRRPLRILMTQERIWIDTKKQPWKFTTKNPTMNPVQWSQKMVDDGKIELRACQGIKKDGTACRVPSLYVGEDGYCKFHRGQKLQRELGLGEDAITQVPTQKDMRNNPQKYKNETPYEYAEIPAPPYKPTHVGNDGVKTIVINPNETVVVKVREIEQDDTYKILIKDFLDGNATMNDLRKAVEQ